MKLLVCILFFCFASTALAQGGMGPGPGVKGYAGGATSFSDNFDRSDRALNGDNGWAWAVGSTGFNIVSNELQIGSTPGDNSQVNSGLSTANGYIQADLKVGGADSSVGFIFRYQDANNFLLMDVNKSGTVIQYSFYKRVSGTYTLINSTTSALLWPANTYTTIKVTFSGSSYEVFKDGVSDAVYSDSSITAAGLGGLRNGNSGSDTRTVDNFVISQ